jgi:hypothetical protein
MHSEAARVEREHRENADRLRREEREEANGLLRDEREDAHRLLRDEREDGHRRLRDEREEARHVRREEREEARRVRRANRRGARRLRREKRRSDRRARTARAARAVANGAPHLVRLGGPAATAGSLVLGLGEPALLAVAAGTAGLTLAHAIGPRRPKSPAAPAHLRAQEHRVLPSDLPSLNGTSANGTQKEHA